MSWKNLSTNFYYQSWNFNSLFLNKYDNLNQIVLFPILPPEEQIDRRRSTPRAISLAHDFLPQGEREFIYKFMFWKPITKWIEYNYNSTTASWSSDQAINLDPSVG